MQLIVLSLAALAGIFPLNPARDTLQNTSPVAVEVRSETPGAGTLVLLGVGLGIAAVVGGSLSQEKEKGKDHVPEAKPMPLLMPARLESESVMAPAKRVDTWDLDSPAPYSYLETESEPTPESYAEVRSLVDEGAVAFLGPKGSGKTSKQTWLMAEHRKRGHIVEAVNPLAAAAALKGIKVYGRGLNYKESAEGIRHFTKEARDRIAKRGIDPNFDPFDQPHRHLGLDELSNYGKRINEIDSEVMPEFWEVCTQFLRQVNMSVSFASHGDTQELMGGERALRGRSKATKQDLIRVFCQRVLDVSIKGNYRCAGWAELTWMEGDAEHRKRIDIPEWMQGPPADNFSQLAPVSQNDIQPLVNVKNNVQTQLSVHLNDIYHLAQKRSRPITARDVAQANLKSISELGLKAEAIRYCFEQLAKQGLGTVEGEGDRLTFSAVEGC